MARVSCWGELRAERRLPGVLRVLVDGQHAGAIWRGGPAWHASHQARVPGPARETEHASADEALRAVLRFRLRPPARRPRRIPGALERPGAPGRLGAAPAPGGPGRQRRKAGRAVSGAERAIRWSTIAAVAAVALIAGWVSYLHAYQVVIVHGEAGAVARLYPGTIDGLIFAASMVLLDAARRGVPAPALARWLLAAGIGATLFANVLAGAAHGPLGAAVAAWPALALVGSYELLMLIIRGQSAPAPAAVQGGSVTDAARTAYRASLAAGAPLSQRAIAGRFGVSRRRAARIVVEAAAEPSGPAGAAQPPRAGHVLAAF